MEATVAGVAVSVVLPEMVPDVAVIFAVPGMRVLARPAVLIVATVVVSDDQVTELVMFCVLLSE